MSSNKILTPFSKKYSKDLLISYLRSSGSNKRAAYVAGLDDLEFRKILIDFDKLKKQDQAETENVKNQIESLILTEKKIRSFTPVIAVFEIAQKYYELLRNLNSEGFSSEMTFEEVVKKLKNSQQYTLLLKLITENMN